MKRQDVTIKIDTEVHRKLRTVAAWKGEDLAPYLTAIIEPILDRELLKMAREIEGREKEEAGD